MRCNGAAFRRDEIMMDIFDVESLKAAVHNGRHPDFLFFWGHTAKSPMVGKHVLSQWWPASFSIDGQRYPTAEHYMMAQKAKLFGDDQTYGNSLPPQLPPGPRLSAAA
jgi:predicted NAD-dependent protein-ADP-ribosyltransferase YbiA (DUF1768 family)